VLGYASQLVRCASSSEAELLALLLAVNATERTNGNASVVFRTDCRSTANPHRGDSKHLRGLRADVTDYLARHPDWRLQEVSRSSNLAATVWREVP